MRKTALYIIAIIFCFAACKRIGENERLSKQLYAIDAIMEDYPDSALYLLDGICRTTENLSVQNEMHINVLRLELEEPGSDYESEEREELVVAIKYYETEDNRHPHLGLLYIQKAKEFQHRKQYVLSAECWLKAEHILSESVFDDANVAYYDHLCMVYYSLYKFYSHIFVYENSREYIDKINYLAEHYNHPYYSYLYHKTNTLYCADTIVALNHVEQARNFALQTEDADENYVSAGYILAMFDERLSVATRCSLLVVDGKYPEDILTLRTLGLICAGSGRHDMAWHCIELMQEKGDSVNGKAVEAEIYFSRGEYRRAYLCKSEYSNAVKKTITDRNVMRIKTLAQEVSTGYLEQENEKLAADNKLKSVYVFLLVVCIVALLVFVCAGFFIVRYRAILQDKEDKKIQEKLQWRQDSLRRILVERIDNMIEMNKYISYNGGGMVSVMKMNGSSLKTKFFNDVNAAYDNLFVKLKQRYPKLTDTGLLLLFVLGLRYSVEDVCILFDFKKETFYVTRSNLRRALELPPNADLADFFDSIQDGTISV